MKNKIIFDKDNSYCYHREGLISGANCSVEIVPSDVVICYEERIPAAEDEDGMQDKGACLYFSGKREGTVLVTLRFVYPTCDSEEVVFSLKVDKNLRVTAEN